MEQAVEYFRPLGDNMLVRRIEGKEAKETAAGLIIPDVAQEKSQKGEVLAVGRGRLEDGRVVEMEVRRGDVILFGKYSGTDIMLNGKPLLVLREAEILGIDRTPAAEERPADEQAAAVEVADDLEDRGGIGALDCADDDDDHDDGDDE